jgi:uncharacterized protein
MKPHERNALIIFFIWLLFFTDGPSRLISEEITADSIMKQYSDMARTARTEDISFISYNFPDKSKTSILTARCFSTIRSSTGDFMKLIRFNSPPGIKGTGILAIVRANGNYEIWIHEPPEERCMQLSATEINGKFMNTEFSYSDILPPNMHDFKHSILKTVKYLGTDCFVIESVPAGLAVKNKTAIGRILSWIKKGDCAGLKTVYYDQYGRLTKTIRCSTFVKSGRSDNKWVPLKITAENNRTSMKTMLESRNISFNSPIPDEWFTIEYLEKE